MDPRISKEILESPEQIMLFLNSLTEEDWHLDLSSKELDLQTILSFLHNLPPTITSLDLSHFKLRLNEFDGFYQIYAAIPKTVLTLNVSNTYLSQYIGCRKAKPENLRAEIILSKDQLDNMFSADKLVGFGSCFPYVRNIRVEDEYGNPVSDRLSQRKVLILNRASGKKLKQETYRLVLDNSQLPADLSHLVNEYLWNGTVKYEDKRAHRYNVDLFIQYMGQEDKMLFFMYSYLLLLIVSTPIMVITGSVLLYCFSLAAATLGLFVFCVSLYCCERNEKTLENTWKKEKEFALKQMESELSLHCVQASDGNIFSAVSMSMLLSAITAEVEGCRREFDSVYDLLFPQASVSQRQLSLFVANVPPLCQRDLRALLTKMDSETPAELKELVDTQLIPNFLSYCKKNNINVDLNQVDSILINALESFLEIKLNVHSEVSEVLMKPYPHPDGEVHLLRSASGFHSLVEPISVPASQQVNCEEKTACNY